MKKTVCVLICFQLILLLSAQTFAAELIPVGSAVGLELEAEGVYAVGFDDVSPARDAGVRQGDLITAVDGAPLDSVQTLTEAVQNSRGGAVVLTLRRDGKAAEIRVVPLRKAGGWRLGLYVKDRMNGIGTVTFYDPETGLFAALGHGVSESGSGALFDLRRGFAVPAEITGVVRGQAGQPGSLQGLATGGPPLGTLYANTACGVFGFADGAPWAGSPTPVAQRETIRTGDAQILTTVDGTVVRAYDVRILEVHPGDRLHRNLLLQVTDPALLAQTGGIVQGMSGSPILQEGRLVGAVTHVLINDPARGYGILAEEMLGAAQAAQYIITELLLFVVFCR